MSASFPDPGILNFILSRRSEERRQQERDQAISMAERNQRQQRADQAFENALRFSQNPDFDVNLILPRLQELGASPGQIGMVEAAGKATKASAKKKEAQAQQQPQKIATLLAQAEGGNRAAGVDASQALAALTRQQGGFAQAQDVLGDVAGNVPFARAGLRESAAQQAEEARKFAIEQRPQDLKILDAVFPNPGPEREEAKRALLERKISGTRTEFERSVASARRRGVISDAEANAFDVARIANLAAGGAGFQISLPDGTTISQGGSSSALAQREGMKLLTDMQRIGDARDVLGGMAKSIREDPTRGGFSARIKNAVSTGMGVAGAFEDLGPESIRVLLEDGRARLRSHVQTDPDFARLYGKYVDREIGSLEIDQVFMSFVLADLFQAGGRLTIAAVNDMRKLVNFKDARGPEQVLRNFEQIEKRLAQSERNAREKAKRLGVETPTRLPATGIAVDPNAPAPTSVLPPGVVPTPGASAHAVRILNVRKIR